MTSKLGYVDVFGSRVQTTAYSVIDSKGSKGVVQEEKSILSQSKGEIYDVKVGLFGRI